MESLPTKPANHRKPILFLFVLSPAIGELLSGSSPPLEFFNPLGFALLASLYGSGALLVREYARRWKKGWRSILILGVAYGIIEEGIMVRSFFNPGWMDLGVLGSYGRWAGVNWVWAEWLTIYHSIFSITIPILLVELFNPTVRAEPWLSNRQKLLFQTLFLVTIPIGFLGFQYDAPFLGLVGCVIAVAFLAWLAKRIPTMRPTTPAWMGGSLKLLLTGFSVPFVFFLFFNSIAPATMPAVLAMILGVFGILGYERLLEHWSRNGFNDIQRLRLATGALGFFIVLSPILEINGALGMTAVGLGFSLLLFKLRKLVGSKLSTANPLPTEEILSPETTIR